MGHYDPWLTEAVQKVVYENRGSQLYPEFRSTSEFLGTSEKFGFVILCDQHLADALKKQLSAIPEDVKREWKLTRDELFLCHQSGFELPFLPVDTLVEVKLFNQLALKSKQSGNLNQAIDFDKMAIEWCDYVMVIRFSQSSQFIFGVIIPLCLQINSLGRKLRLWFHLVRNNNCLKYLKVLLT